MLPVARAPRPRLPLGERSMSERETQLMALPRTSSMSELVVRLDFTVNEVKEMIAEIDKLRTALDFIISLAEEEYKVGTGAEVALRHIIRRAREVRGV
jgi:hypothetical protein